MAEMLKVDESKINQINSMVGLERQIKNAQSKIDDCDLALVDNARLVSESTDRYNKEKANAQSVITAAKLNLKNLRDKVVAGGKHNVTEVAEYDKAITDANTLTVK